jgi:NADPH:quinone reductase-like Zn-dependent oxidoreductase
MDETRTPPPQHLPTEAVPRAMQAVVQRGYGDADRMHLTQVEVPALRDDEVLVAVHAAGLDRGTWHLLHGTPLAVRAAIGLRRPRQAVMGLALSGTVVAVGPRVTRVHPGDRVFGTGRGSFAQYCAAREGKLALAPRGLDPTAAAAVPVSGVTAYQALRGVGQVQAGQRVLVLGAAGGVGSYAVQIAAAAGAHVTAVCSASKADFVTGLGADRVVDRTRPLDTLDERFDLVLDIAGDPPLGLLRRLLTPTGTAVIVGSEQGGALLSGMGRQMRALVVSPVLRQRLVPLASRDNHVDLERLTGLLEAGSVVPRVDRVFPLAESAEAMRYLESGQVRGKIVISLAG